MTHDPEQTRRLIDAARAAMARAYAPYSKFRVGAAVEAGGEVYSGCNVENASYGLTICAERNAVGAAIAAGQTLIEAIAIATDTDAPTPPCGACRQVLAEFGPTMSIHMAGRSSNMKTMRLDELLPHRFESKK